MEFHEFKIKLIERKRYLAMLKYSRSEKERLELNENIAMLEKWKIKHFKIAIQQ